MPRKLSSLTSDSLSALGLVARLLAAPGRNRADLCYAFLGTRNCPSTDCTYLNFGYWRCATDYCAAAEALVDLLGDAAGIAEGDVVVDVGCGFGDQDVRLARTRRPHCIHAVNVSELQLTHARLHNADPRIVYRNCSATRLPFADGSIDKVVSLEAAFHFDTRESFLREAFRVLKPAGRIAVLDLVALEQEGKAHTGGLHGWLDRWRWQVPSANAYGMTEYGRILQSIGFVDCTLRSVREDVIPGFSAFMRGLLADPAAMQRFHPVVRHGMRHSGDPFANTDYLLVTAAKPHGH